MKKFLIAAMALAIVATPALAKHKQINQNWNGGGNWDGQHFAGNDMPPPPPYKPYKHKHKNNNDNFYQDPNFWAGVAGGLIGGAVIDGIQNDYYPEPYPYPYPNTVISPRALPVCVNVMVPRCVVGLGCRYVQDIICN